MTSEQDLAALLSVPDIVGVGGTVTRAARRRGVGMATAAANGEGYPDAAADVVKTAAGNVFGPVRLST